MSTFPFGGGKMGQAIREFDWKASTLGLPEDWCESLRANLNLMLNSPFAMCMAWGPSLLFFHNDAYSEVLGKRHGSSLGRPMVEVWWDIWDDIKPWIDEAGERAPGGLSPLKRKKWPPSRGRRLNWSPHLHVH